MSVDIPAKYLPYVREAVASGRFESESALVGEAIDLLLRREHEMKLVEEGLNELDRGAYVEFDEDELAQFFADVKRQGRQQLVEIVRVVHGARSFKDLDD